MTPHSVDPSAAPRSGSTDPASGVVAFCPDCCCRRVHDVAMTDLVTPPAPELTCRSCGTRTIDIAEDDDA